MVSSATKRAAVDFVASSGLSSVVRACRALSLSASSFYARSRLSARSRRLRAEIVRLSREHPRCGYRRITALLRRAGEEVNPKRVARARRLHGLQVPRRQRKRFGHRPRNPVVSEPSERGTCGVGTFSSIKFGKGRG